MKVTATSQIRPETERPQRVGGFSLLELLVVMAILTAVIGLTIPAVRHLSGGGGRRSAVIQLTNTFEQARALALQRGVRVYVAFAGADFPETEKRLRRYMVLRDRAPEVDGDGPPVINLTGWRTLPTGISFVNEPLSIVDASSGATVQAVVPVGAGAPQELELPCLVFNPMGMIEQPASSHLRLFIYQGFHREGVDVPTTQDIYYDHIRFSRFTGRSQWVVAEVANE